ncbi:replication protein A 32 kDa subunit-like [Tubulanus polymorphus]|uniref:replication protein A 32 kDa subunit-like n=1 Tax=Tubulanus polymorphus TaxID=672921 RepID=UPI003DA3FC42
MWGNDGNFQNYPQQGGSGGGGFMNSPGFGSPSIGTLDKKKSRSNNLIPCTVAGIMDAEIIDGKFFAVNGNVELNQVALVALIRSVNETSSRIDYIVDDMTGPPFEVKQFVDNEEGTPEEDKVKPLTENTYVRMFGHLRAFQDKRSLAAFKVEPVTDMNDLTTHILEVIYSCLWYTKAQNQPAEGSNTASKGGMVDYGNTGNSNSYQSVDSGLTPIQNQVHKVIRAATGEQGIGRSEIGFQMRGIPEKQIRDAIDFLSGEGHIYSTIDDDHFRTTDS